MGFQSPAHLPIIIRSRDDRHLLVTVGKRQAESGCRSVDGGYSGNRNGLYLRMPLFHQPHQMDICAVQHRIPFGDERDIFPLLKMAPYRIHGFVPLLFQRLFIFGHREG
ncbi:Uncharacterised protein [Mycobacterium tuberculosis]|nr:Uncharacterised protein [Mycobacterium tuberculosis]